MKGAGLTLHVVVVWLLTLGLVGLSWWQWLEIDHCQTVATEQSEKRGVAEAERDAARDQVAALSRSLLEAERTEARNRRERDKLQLATATLLTEVKNRNKQIERLAAHFDEARGRLGAAQELLEDAAGIETAVAERDEIIRGLQAEREQLAARLNDRTNAYNELVKKVEAAQ